jgi:hypothetical protein
MRLPYRFTLFLALFLSFGVRRAAAEPFVGTRSLGMGEGLRGAATGVSGPLLNPSGMSLIQSYTVEADYAFAHVRDEQFLHASIVDSTSGYKVAGGFYYTYHTDNPDGPAAGHSHEGGLALSMPLGDHLAIGATGKYFLLAGDQTAASGSTGGFTYDVGVTARPIRMLSVGVVGTNLRKLNTGVAPMAVGYGLAFSPNDIVLVVADGVTNLTADAPLPRKGTRVSAGTEIFLAKMVVLRGGGGYDGVTQNGFFTAGFAAVSEVGALDLGVRQDAFHSGSSPRETIFGASFRLFVPQP